MTLVPEMVDTFFNYLNERERIRLNKEAGLPKPWTKDPILQNFKFTNVLRQNDTVSRWLITNWYKSHENHPFELQLLNCGIARYFGTWEFCEALGWQEEWNPDFIIETAKKRLKSKQRVFTGAYVITNGGISAPKEEVVVGEYLTPFWKLCPELVRIARETRRWQAVAELLMTVPGFGGSGFMTKETLSDAIYTPVLRDCSDRNSWSPAGPGARRGLNRLHGRDTKASLPFDQALREMKELFEMAYSRFESHMPEVGKDFDLHAIQFALCEVDKWNRVKNGEGRPRSTYPGIK